MRLEVAIVGAGITGLAVARWLEHDHGVRNLVVLEAGDRPGGKLWSERRDGHLLEWGPQGFLDNAPDTLELIRLEGLEDRVAQADEQSADRFIFRQGRLRRVPLKPLSFIASDILPFGARLRVLCEPFARSRPDEEESVLDFASRRIGRRAAEVLVDAMVTGVFAGDPAQLSLPATFPRMAAMEAEHGSLTRAMLAKMRQARADGRRQGGPAGPGGRLTTFQEGMVELPQRLAAGLGDRLRLNNPVRTVRRIDDGFELSGELSSVSASRLLLAVPAPEAARLLAPVAPEAVTALAGIGSASLAVVMSSYLPEEFPGAMRGFGFLVPGQERLGILGALYCHSIFPGQAPAGTVFLRTMLGGAREPHVAQLEDHDLDRRVRDALGVVMGREPAPTQQWIVRHGEGIAQYTMGHLGRVERAEAAASSVGIDLAGSPYRGVSVNDCIRQARQAASRLATPG